MLVVIALLLPPLMASPQQPQPAMPQNIIKIDLFSPVYRSFFGYYERVLSPESSMQFGLLASGSFTLVTGGYRFYLSDTPAPKGVYVSPTIAMGAAESGSYHNREVVFGAALLVGTQGLFRQKITIEANLGPAWIHDSDGGHFIIFGGIVIGVAF